MPHQCTSCGRVFPDGSKEMLSGCPDCGGNKFQFHPSSSRSASRSAAAPEESPEESPPSSAAPTDETAATEAGDGSERAHGEWPDHSREHTRDDPAAPSPRESASSSTREPDSNTTGTETPSNQPTASSSAADTDRTSEEDVEVDTDELPPDVEDRAQASARTDVVSRDELAHAAEESPPTRPPESEGRVIEPSSEDRPGLDELREELNSQFESIKIVNPGQYELNLMELYDRQEYIISLQEDGRYVIEMPDSWGDREESD